MFKLALSDKTYKSLNISLHYYHRYNDLKASICQLSTIPRTLPQISLTLCWISYEHSSTDPKLPTFSPIHTSQDALKGNFVNPCAARARFMSCKTWRNSREREKMIVAAGNLWRQRAYTRSHPCGPVERGVQKLPRVILYYIIFQIQI